MQAEVTQALFEQGLAQACAKGRTSDEHFSTNMMMIEAWASLKSFRPHDGADDPRTGGGRNAEQNFRGVRRKNHTHVSTMDLQAHLFQKGKGKVARMYYKATPGQHRITLGSDKNHDTQEFGAPMRAIDMTPHVAQNDTNRRMAIDGRTTRHAGYAISQCVRNQIEEAISCRKDIGPVRKTSFRGFDRINDQ